MADKIYGVDPGSKYTPQDVLSALNLCFYTAHCQDTGVSMEVSKQYCGEIIKKAFTETNGDIENPTKDSLMKVIGYLAGFSKNFRDPEVVKKHFEEMATLIKGLP